MGFIIYPPCQSEGGGSGGAGDSPVKSVNGKIGHVFLTHRDINAVRNLQSSIGGIQAGAMNEIPLTPEQGTIFITTDRVPNTVYFYNRNKWEKLSGEEEDLKAIAVKFDNSKVSSRADNVQKALEDAFYQIDFNKKDFILKLDEINKELGLIEKSDGKIKLTEYDKLDFLDKKLSPNLKVENNILTVKGIDGLLSTIKELNSLRNIKGNVQEQLDKLSNVSGLSKTVDTYKELLELNTDELMVNDLVIVLEDETKGKNSTMYMLNKNKGWTFIGAYDINVEVRDFELDPIDLDKEVKGVLEESKIDKALVRREELDELKDLIVIKSTDDLPEGQQNKYYSKDKVDRDINTNRKVSEAYDSSHVHYNKETIDEIGETEEGLLTFRGRVLGGDFEGEIPPVIMESDGRIKVTANDVLGYLSTKIDNKTLTTDGKKVYASSLVGMLANIEEINYLLGARENIQDQIDKGQGTIKIDRYDELGYLGNKIDKDTIVVQDGVLKAQKLNGQTVSIGELNYSKGLKGNIQEQINNLSKVGSFTKIVDNHSDLISIKDPTNGDLVMVSKDETHEGKTTFYMFDNGKWVYGGDFHIELRDFETDPIKLGSEVAGVLREDRIDPRIARKSDLEEIRVNSTDDVQEGKINKYFSDDKVAENKEVKKNTEKRHEHYNTEVLESLSEDNNTGRLLYNGKEIKSEGEILWEDF